MSAYFANIFGPEALIVLFLLLAIIVGGIVLIVFIVRYAVRKELDLKNGSNKPPPYLGFFLNSNRDDAAAPGQIHLRYDARLRVLQAN